MTPIFSLFISFFLSLKYTKNIEGQNAKDPLPIN